MITFADVGLLAPLAATVAQVEAVIDPDQVLDWELRHQPGRLRHNSFPMGTPTRQPFRLNSLFWPVGASRWALGRFLVDETKVEELRAVVYGDGTEYQSGTFTMNDGRDLGDVSTPLYMLPPRPIYQCPNSNWLWLVTLVDDRFFWWERSGIVAVTEDTTTWAQLYSQIAGILGISLTVETVAAEYLKPSHDLDSSYGPMPLLLDAVARAVGQRIVRNLDGTVTAQSVASAKAAVLLNLAEAFPIHAGGLFQLQLI